MENLRYCRRIRAGLGTAFFCVLKAVFFYKERKRTQECCVLLKRTFALPWGNLHLRPKKYSFLLFLLNTSVDNTRHDVPNCFRIPIPKCHLIMLLFNLAPGLKLCLPLPYKISTHKKSKHLLSLRLGVMSSLIFLKLKMKRNSIFVSFVQVKNVLVHIGCKKI